VCDVCVRCELAFASFVIGTANGKIAGFDQAAELAQTPSDLVAMAALRQRLEVNFIWLNRDAVTPPVIRIFEDKPAFTGEPARAGAQVSAPGVGIEYRAEGRPVIVSLLPTDTAEEDKVLHAIF